MKFRKITQLLLAATLLLTATTNAFASDTDNGVLQDPELRGTVFLPVISSFNTSGAKDTAVTVESARADVATPVASKDDVVVAKDGRLVFTDQTAFNDFMRSVEGKTDGALDSIEKGLRFRSMRTYAAEQIPTKQQIAEAGEDGIDEDFWMVVQDPYLATVLNPDGIIQIGKDVHRVTTKAVYTASSQDTLAMESLAKGLSSLDTQSGINKSFWNFSYLQDSCTDRNGKYRVKGSSWILNLSFYASAGSRTKFQRRNWLGIWKQQNAGQLTVAPTYNLNVSGTPMSNSFAMNSQNSSNVGGVFLSDLPGFDANWNWIWTDISGTVSSSHLATNNESGYACDTYVWR